MSPKYSSLAFDEVKNEEGDLLDCHFDHPEPTLNLLIKSSLRSSSSAIRQPVALVEGRITVSF